MFHTRPFIALKQEKKAFTDSKASVFLILGLCLLGLAACGKRPPAVESPKGGAAKERIYPDPQTDPAP